MWIRPVWRSRIAAGLWDCALFTMQSLSLPMCAFRGRTLSPRKGPDSELLLLRLILDGSRFLQRVSGFRSAYWRFAENGPANAFNGACPSVNTQQSPAKLPRWLATFSQWKP